MMNHHNEARKRATEQTLSNVERAASARKPCWPGRDAWKAFHDEFLSYGGPPIPMVRKAMIKESEAKAVF